MRMNTQVDPPALARTTPDDRLGLIPHHVALDVITAKRGAPRVGHTTTHRRDSDAG